MPTTGSQNTRNNNNIDNLKMAGGLGCGHQLVRPDRVLGQYRVRCHASLFPGCVPLNMFGPTSETQAVIELRHHRDRVQGVDQAA